MEKRLQIQIDNALHGKKVKYILRNHLGLSVAIVRKLKQENGIYLNGEAAKQDTVAEAGDTLVLTISDVKSDAIEPVDIPLHILYEDEDLIALNKPRAMPTHPSQNHHDDTLANGIMYYFKEKDFTFRVITRLDRDTSGVVLVAKNKMSAHFLGMAMQKGEIEKEYMAAVCGVPNPEKGCIKAPIRRKTDSIILRTTALDGKYAETHYAVEKTKNGLSLLRLYPKTGRTHQLRVHMQYIGTPIYGDGLYGNAPDGERTRLHCRKITFPHPSTGAKTEITAPVPEDMRALFI